MGFKREKSLFFAKCQYHFTGTSTRGFRYLCLLLVKKKSCYTRTMRLPKHPFIVPSPSAPTPRQVYCQSSCNWKFDHREENRVPLPRLADLANLLPISINRATWSTSVSVKLANQRWSENQLAMSDQTGTQCNMGGICDVEVFMVKGILNRRNREGLVKSSNQLRFAEQMFPGMWILDALYNISNSK